MITKYDRELDHILSANAGVITSGDAQAAGATRPAFSDYVQRRGLERISRGVYADPSMFADEMVLLQKRFPKAIFSHDSALYLHDMTDHEPMPLSVTVDSNYNATPLKDQGIRVHYVKPEWYSLGVAEAQTPSGGTVQAYDRERTICDLIRRRTSTDSAVFRQAIRSYVRSKNKNMTRLSEYAKTMNMESRVREVMEVAL
ncbi:type IV toxin-antitoxin system AbiEi family antitoxin domain-containing protein [Eggerthellaceae bacterium 24-137]